MTEIASLQVVPQIKMVKVANGENSSKAYLLSEPINDTVVLTKGEKKGGGVGKGILSFMFPGLGQLFDGRIGAGLGFIGAMSGFGLGGYIIGKKAAVNYFSKLKPKELMIKQKVFDKLVKKGDFVKLQKNLFAQAIKALKTMPKSYKLATVGLSIAALGTRIFSAFDAAKGKKD